MSDIVNEAVLFDTYYEDVTAGKDAKDIKTTVTDKIPQFQDFYISNVFCRGAKTAISITGLPQMPVRKIYFDNIVVSADKGYESKDAKDIDFKKVRLILPDKVQNLTSVQ